MPQTKQVQSAHETIQPIPPRTRTSGPRTLPGTSLSSCKTPAVFLLDDWPYLDYEDRLAIVNGVSGLENGSDYLRKGKRRIYHIDFTEQEAASVLKKSCKGTYTIKSSMQYSWQQRHSLPQRSATSIANFLKDAENGHANVSSTPLIMSIRSKLASTSQQQLSQLPSLLFARQLDGVTRMGQGRALYNFQTLCQIIVDDQLTGVSEYTNCASDIFTICWLPGHAFLCGTITHCDEHNQQYNKQGNLLLCSTNNDQLRAFDDHRVLRPIVDKGENSTEAMRQSQDPWLYTSVVSSDYDAINKKAYTSSFDGTIKTWVVNDAGTSMHATETWQHHGRVNFAAAAKDGSGLVAVAADVRSEAVRIYDTKAEPVAEECPYWTISCSRTDAHDSQDWAYCPATIAWCPVEGYQHLLLIGYSPRGLALAHDTEIPEDKRNSGEIALWDTREKRRLQVTTATSANVFEVAWHPTLASFAVATSPSSLVIRATARTQIHLFKPDAGRPRDCFHEYESLDCPAVDINELTFKPNSAFHAYITAACTDSNVYVWDTSRRGRPLHILSHGKPADEIEGDLETFDTGVKFTAWSKGTDRFYTGSSDGVVKVWNVRNIEQPFLCDLMHAPAPITCGAFSPDNSWLAIGDASGRVFTFSTTDRTGSLADRIAIPGVDRTIRRPRPFIPHPEPAAPVSGVELARAMLARKQIVLHPNPVVGAVQGEEYLSCGYHLREAHLDGDPSAPLQWSRRDQQLRQELRHANTSGLQRKMPILKDVEVDDKRLEEQHTANARLDYDVDALGVEELAALMKDGADFSTEGDWDFSYEEPYDDASEDDEMEMT